MLINVVFSVLDAEESSLFVRDQCSWISWDIPPHKFTSTRTYNKVMIHFTCLRPRNINWQDWKYTSFVVFVGYSQNRQRHNAMCRDEPVADVVENIGLKLQFSSWISILLLLHRLCRFYHQINSICKLMRHYWI